VAKQTRAERRARRQQQAESSDGLAQRARARQAQVRPAQQVKSQTGARSVPGGGGRRFVGESIAELRKVEWPSQAQVIQGVVVVLIACVIVGFYLWVADQAFRHLVQDLLL
jgi:preprotein translocase SecE subunit